MPIDLPPKLWTPPKPAIIRAAPEDLATIRRARADHIRGGRFVPGMLVGGLGVNALSGGGGRKSAAQPATISYRTTSKDSVNRSQYTFAALDIGTASADRLVVLSITCCHTTTFSIVSVLIGGNSATIHDQQLGVTGTNQSIVAIVSYPLTSGATADIVINPSTTIIDATVTSWALASLISQTPVTNKSTAAPLDMSLNTQANGVGVAGYTDFGGSGYSLTGLTQRVARTNIESSLSYGAADWTSSNAETPRTLQVAVSGSPSYGAGVAAFWR